MKQETMLRDRIDKYEAAKMYKIQQLSIREIARRLGYSKSNVAR